MAAKLSGKMSEPGIVELIGLVSARMVVEDHARAMR